MKEWIMGQMRLAGPADSIQNGIGRSSVPKHPLTINLREITNREERLRSIIGMQEQRWMYLTEKVR